VLAIRHEIRYRNVDFAKTLVAALAFHSGNTHGASNILKRSSITSRRLWHRKPLAPEACVRRADMLAADSKPDEARGDSPQHRKAFEHPQDERHLRQDRLAQD